MRAKNRGGGLYDEQTERAASGGECNKWACMVVGKWGKVGWRRKMVLESTPASAKLCAAVVEEGL